MCAGAGSSLPPPAFRPAAVPAPEGSRNPWLAHPAARLAASIASYSRTGAVSAARITVMANMRRRSPGPPAGLSQVQFRPALADETLRDLAPSLRDDGSDV